MQNDLIPEKRTSSVAAVAQSIGAKLGIILINAATGILTARTLAPEGRGQLATLILWPVFLASALTFGLPSALTFQLQRNREKQSSLLAAGLLLAITGGILAIAAGICFLPFWIPQYDPKIIFWARIFVLSAPLQSISLAGRAALESRGNFTASNKLLIVSPALTLLWLLVLMLTHAMTPLRAGFAYVVVGVIPTAWMAMQLWREFQPSLHGAQTSIRLLLSYGIRSYGIDLCGAMALYVDQALVIRILTPSMMGIYVVALSLSRMLNAFHTSVVMVLFPRAIRETPENIREMTGRSARISTLITTAAGLFIILLGPQVLALLYGAQYRDAAPVLRVLVIEVILAGITTVLSQAFMAMGRPGIVTTMQVIGLLLTIPLLLMLTPRYHLLGAGIALLLSTTIRFVFVLIGFPLFLKLPMPHILATTKDVRQLCHILMHFRKMHPAARQTNE